MSALSLSHMHSFSVPNRFMSNVMFEKCAEPKSCVTMSIDDSFVEGDELLDVILTNNTDVGNITLRGGTLRIIHDDFNGMCYMPNVQHFIKQFLTH